ncbi:TonB-dependent receptor domain-containing protein, partial [Shigella flexneri]|uniref:TonB-dependent receptor domain-containing protein n=1 Tax=Shigella flexneri TaxID=623 RepID=UPI001493C0AC
DLGFANLTSYSQYRSENSVMSQDLDYSGADIFQLGLPNINETWSQELLLTSKAGPKLQWTAGLFYFQNTDTYITYINNAGNAPNERIRLGGSSTTVKSYAAFLDATYEFTPQLFLTAGARYSQDKIVDAYWNRSFTDIRVPVPNISNNKLT